MARKRIANRWKLADRAIFHDQGQQRIRHELLSKMHKIVERRRWWTWRRNCWRLETWQKKNYETRCASYPAHSMSFCILLKPENHSLCFFLPFSFNIKTTAAIRDCREESGSPLSSWNVRWSSHNDLMYVHRQNEEKTSRERWNYDSILWIFWCHDPLVGGWEAFRHEFVSQALCDSLPRGSWVFAELFIRRAASKLLGFAGSIFFHDLCSKVEADFIVRLFAFWLVLDHKTLWWWLSLARSFEDLWVHVTAGRALKKQFWKTSSSPSDVPERRRKKVCNYETHN